MTGLAIYETIGLIIGIIFLIISIKKGNETFAWVGVVFLSAGVAPWLISLIIQNK